MLERPTAASGQDDVTSCPANTAKALGIRRASLPGS